MKSTTENKVTEAVAGIEEYFTTRICQGEYVVREIDDYTMKIFIGNFKFVLWVANGESCFRTYDEGNFMRLEFSEADKSVSWMFVERAQKQYYEEHQRAKDEKELIRLTQQLKK